MTRIAFCAALYEAGRCYLPAFMAGIRAAARGHEACLVAAIDGLVAPHAALAELADDLPLHLTACERGSSQAKVRRIMLEAGMRSGADILVFVDMDDMLLGNAPGNHLDALANADFSYGDLCLMDATGQDLRRRFYDRADVPWQVTSVDAVQRRNFLGLSNTAIRTARLPVSALQVPDDVLAVDWWLFTTLLQAGRRGVRTVAPVVHYRLHADNALGAGTPATPEALRRSYTIMRRHYRAFRATPGAAASLARVEALLDRLDHTPPGVVAARLAALRDRPGVWYQGLDEVDFEAATAVAITG